MTVCMLICFKGMLISSGVLKGALVEERLRAEVGSE